MRFHKILCAIDFSAGSDAAMQTALRIANDHDAELVLAHVLYLPPVAANINRSLVEQVASEAERMLEQTRKRLAGKRVSARMLEGIPWSAIVDTAERDLAFDLIVVGTTGKTGLSRFLLGSVSEKILRHAPCSVLVVRPDSPPGPYSRVVCPIDFSIDAEEALELSAALAAPTSSITLLHVNEIPYGYLDDGPLTDLTRRLDLDAKLLMEQTATMLRERVVVPVDTKIVDGRFPGARLLDELERDPTIDLVVMGSHGRTGIRRALLGSVAEKVARHAAAPVLVSRARDRAN